MSVQINQKDTARIIGVNVRKLENWRLYYPEKLPEHTYKKTRPFYDSEELRRWINEERAKAEALYTERLETLEELTATAESEAA